MVSNKIENLTNEDLEYLDKILQKEMRRQQSEAEVFKAKNGYTSGTSTNRISKLRDAFRSQKNLKNMPKW